MLNSLSLPAYQNSFGGSHDPSCQLNLSRSAQHAHFPVRNYNVRQLLQFSIDFSVFSSGRYNLEKDGDCDI